MKFQNYEEFAGFLRIDVVELLSILNAIKEGQLYEQFNIPKKSRGIRQIKAPQKKLRQLQRRFNDGLTSFYQHFSNKTNPAHGFLPDRNIKTNAEIHINKRAILNIDLENFFPSVTFTRICNLFSGKLFKNSIKISETMAHLCCFEDSLPQGAPTSPILTNFICIKLDRRLNGLANANTCNYTRYADDITFSTDNKDFDPLVMKEKVRKIIEEEGFRINEKKYRLEKFHKKQVVTGLTVNKKVNIDRRYLRKIRAILHSIEKLGLVNAANFYSIYGREHMIMSLQGKINFIGDTRGKNDEIYLKFKNKFAILTSQKIPV